MNGVEPSDYARGRIAAIVDAALRDSGALGELPTPLAAVRRHAGIELVAPRGLREDILGALWFEERTMFVQPAQPRARRRFTEAHELVHALCPWHRAVLRLDTEAELFRPARDAIEAEANAGAAMLVFQGSSFAARAGAAPPSLAAVRELAAAHGASLHATLHHYAQVHPEAVAMLTVGRFPRKDGTLPVWRGVESSAFRAQAGPAAALAPEGLAPGSELHALVESARTAGDGPPGVVELGGRRLRAQAHYNRHAFLVLAVPAERVLTAV